MGVVQLKEPKFGPRPAGHPVARRGIVAFKGVTKTYDGRSQIVAGLDLEIEQGEFLTLLGPSGSGKTTTLMMLAGFEVPTTGEIFLEDQPLTRLPPHRRDIGMVFQNYALFPHMSIVENIAFPLQVRNIPRGEIAERVGKALDMVRLPHIGDRKPGQLSGGQQQRVALARALVFEPRLVLMDEPLGALDKQLREHMQYEIRALHAKLGITVVYVTHDQTEALTMSDRIAVFSHGRVRQLADPETLYERPSDGFVAGFVGESNRFDGVLAEIADGRARIALDEATAIRATPVDLASPRPAMVIVRPEHIVIGEAARGMVNQLQGVVEDVVYHGDHLRVHITFRAASIVARIIKGTAPPPDIGTEVPFAFSPDHARAYDPDIARH